MFKYVGYLFGLELNPEKCEYLAFNSESRVYFRTLIHYVNAHVNFVRAKMTLGPWCHQYIKLNNWGSG